MTDEWVFSREFEPRLKPNEYVLINNQYYQVIETRPMLPFYLTLTNLTAQQTLDLRAVSYTHLTLPTILRV